MTARAPSAEEAGRGEDCYQRIGVYGDGSCPELLRHIHCRNCPVFASAAQSRLDRPLPDDYRSSWARHYSAPRTETHTELSSLLVFRIGSQWLALPAAVIEEVATLRRVHRLPHRQSRIVSGIATIRGELLTCVSLARVLDAEPANGSEGNSGHGYGRMLVLNRAASRFVTQVDEVQGIQSYSETELTPPPATLGKAAGTFTRGVLSWGAHAVGCLDDELLFHFLERNLA